MSDTRYWLMKTEPDVFSIDDLKKDGETIWSGVRNYQARNFMMNEMKLGDKVLFYHSNAEPPGVAGLAVVSRLAEPDPTAFDKKSEYFEPKATKENPRWFCVRVKFAEKFKNLVPLDKIKNDPKLKEMLVIKRGQRLSIQPVSKKDYEYIVRLSR